MKSDSNAKNVLVDDGLSKDSLIKFHEYENIETINLNELRKRFSTCRKNYSF